MCSIVCVWQGRKWIWFSRMNSCRKLLVLKLSSCSVCCSVWGRGGLRDKRLWGEAGLRSKLFKGWWYKRWIEQGKLWLKCSEIFIKDWSELPFIGQTLTEQGDDKTLFDPNNVAGLQIGVVGLINNAYTNLFDQRV